MNGRKLSIRIRCDQMCFLLIYLCVCVCVCVCVYLCLAPCALLDEAARKRGSHRVALKKAANGVTETQSNQLLEEEKQQDRYNISN